MARCIFENLTPEQALTLARWYEGQGEQDCEPWFDEQDVKVPYTNCSREGGYKEQLDNGDVIVYCETKE